MRKPRAFRNRLDRVGDSFRRGVELLNTAGAVVGILAFVATVIIWVIGVVLRNAGVVELDQTLWSVVTLCICSVIVAVSVAFAFSRFQVTRDLLTDDAKSIIKLERVAKESDAVMELLATAAEENCRDMRQNTLRTRLLSSVGFDNEECLRHVRQNWIDHTQRLLELTRAIFGKLTGEDCSVCIKLAGYDTAFGDLPVVATMGRDNASTSKRRDADRQYPIYAAHANTAFNSILFDPSFRGVFVCDNLAALPYYANVNANWRDYYNATLVVPIGAEHFSIDCSGAQETKCFDLIAFLCIDSLKGSFNNEGCIAAARLLSKLYNEYLNNIARIYFTHREAEFGRGDRSSPLYEYRENRPLGLTLTRAVVGVQRIVKTHQETMVIYRMHKYWPGWERAHQEQLIVPTPTEP